MDLVYHWAALVDKGQSGGQLEENLWNVCSILSRKEPTREAQEADKLIYKIYIDFRQSKPIRKM